MVMVCLFGMVVNADTVVFKNGDKLSGKIVSISGGKLVIKTEVAGEVKVDFGKVSSFETAEPGKFNLNDGTTINSTASQGSAGEIKLEGTEIMSGGVVSLGSIKSLNPPVVPEVVWKGNVGIGLSSTHGNTFSERGSVSVNLNRRSQKHRSKLGGLYQIGRNKDADGKKMTTEESLTLDAKHDYFISEKVYSYINGRFKKDHIADLDYRIIAGMGLGYQWLDQDNMHFSTDVGLAELCEQYTTGGEKTRESELSLALGYDYDWQITEKLLFVHNLDYYPSFDDFADYFLHIDGELKYKISGSMFTSLKAILDYDTSPGESVGRTDTKYVMNVGWEF